MLEQAVIYTFVALVLIGGGLAAFSRQILYAIIGLGISLLGLAGLFLNLGSPFVAAMQVLIYIGGITVAIVFCHDALDSHVHSPARSRRSKTRLRHSLCRHLFWRSRLSDPRRAIPRNRVPGILKKLGLWARWAMHCSRITMSSLKPSPSFCSWPSSAPS